MAGIYLHIPFCRQACTYCNFHFTTSLRYKDELLQAMKQELLGEKDYLKGESVQTVYFGGGTPSLLSEKEIAGLMDTIQNLYHLSPDAEMTLEANPDDISEEKLKGWKRSGINRLSIGVQSFFDEELKWMNRAHNALQAEEGLLLARQEFENLTMDLIYGSPLLTDEMWKENVNRALDLNIPHLSCYALTVEEQTPLYKNILSKKTADVDADKQARQFLLLMQWLKEKGYEHYEVSNFAQPGFRSRHNSSYWKGENYLGIGPSAHSYNGKERRWNAANNSIYISSMKQGAAKRESEWLTPEQGLNEYIMISLRTVEGMDLEKIEQEWGSGERKRAEGHLSKFIQQGWIRFHHSIASLTDEGMLHADGIAADLFKEAASC